MCCEYVVNTCSLEAFCVSGFVMSEMSESLWISKCWVVGRIGVTVPERGVDEAEDGSGVVSPRNSGGVGGW